MSARMQTLPAAAWLSLWDMAVHEPVLIRSRRIAAAAWPGEDVDADTPGRRNWRLLAVRRELFGRHMACVSTCPECGAMLDITLDVDELSALHDQSLAHMRLQYEGAKYSFRLPTLRDVADVLEDNTEPALQHLARRCLLDGNPAAMAEKGLIAVLSGACDSADPLGHVTIDLLCPQCGMRNLPVLDITALLCGELGAMIDRLLVQVHTLAKAYGWSEADILTLPSERRQLYVEMVQT